MQTDYWTKQSLQRKVKQEGKSTRLSRYFFALWNMSPKNWHSRRESLILEDGVCSHRFWRKMLTFLTSVVHAEPEAVSCLESGGLFFWPFTANALQWKSQSLWQSALGLKGASADRHSPVRGPFTLMRSQDDGRQRDVTRSSSMMQASASEAAADTHRL